MATNLLMMYVGIEMVSLCSYIFTAFRKVKQGSEAGLKYALFGAAASAVMLYGMSWIYGITGTLSLADSAFGRDLFANTDSPMTLLACAFTLGGFLFKLASVPFHLWTPDTYQASPTPLVSFFSVAPKMAALALAIRFVIVAQVQLQTLLVYVCIATLAVGNFTALWQTNAKRLLAYSSIAQAGFMLIGLVAMGALGIKSLLFYMATYLFMSMLAFLLIDICFDDKAQAADMAGFGRRHPFWAVLFTLAMVALAGLPPTVGFTAKFLAFSSLWDSYVKSQQTLFVVLFAFGLFNMVVSLFYYLKIPYIMFFKESPDSEPFINPTLGQKVLSITLAIPILYLFFDVNFLMKWITVLLER
jgi:NADH-quinone oxidoreductase subunit N